MCEVVVMKGETRTGFYLHEVQIKKKLLDVFKTGVVTGTSGASKSTLLNVWQRVKQIEENCSKVVDENGEPLVVYHGSQKKKDLACLTRNRDIILMQSGLAIVRMWPRIGVEQAAPFALTIA